MALITTIGLPVILILVAWFTIRAIFGVLLPSLALLGFLLWFLSLVVV